MYIDERRSSTINKKAALAAATIILTVSLSSGSVLPAETTPVAQITREDEEKPVTLYFAYAGDSEPENNIAEESEETIPVISGEDSAASLTLAEALPIETAFNVQDKEKTGFDILEQVSFSLDSVQQTEETTDEQAEDISEQQDEVASEQQDEDISEQNKRYTEAEKKMIAKVVYAEARGECFDGQVAVAQVVINRYESGKFGASVKRIVYGKYQFAVSKRYSKACMKAVEYAIDNMPYPDNMYFFQVSKRKHWRNFVYYNRIGNHSFYCGKE